MSCRKSSRLQRVSLIIAGMTIAFLAVFIVTLLAGYAIRGTNYPVSKFPATISPTSTSGESKTAIPVAQPPTALPITVTPVKPSDESPTAAAPTTSAAPTTAASLTISATTTSTPTTSVPTTSAPTTSVPTTSVPTTSAPTTSEPTTTAPTTSVPTTFAPTTAAPTTIAPPTAAPTPQIIQSDLMEWIQVGERIDGEMRQHSLDNQPVSISYNGNRVVLGSAGGGGAVEIYDFDGIHWNRVGGVSGLKKDGFGLSVALSGNGKRLAIGARYSKLSGHAEVHEIIKDDDWSLVGEELIGEPQDWFGYAVAMSKDGSHVAIGAPRSNVHGTDSGCVQIFEFVGNAWEQKGQTLVGESDLDYFGESVAMSEDGSIVAIGAPNSNQNGNGSGSVRVFQYSSNRRMVYEPGSARKNQRRQDFGQWVQFGQTLHGRASGDKFGRSISINGNGYTIAIGSENGYAQVFQLVDYTWDPLGQTFRGEGDEKFGYSVSLATNVDRIAIGSYVRSGEKVTIFDYNGNTWMQTGDISAPLSETYFGTSISISSSGDKVAIGSISRDRTYRGHLRVFEVNE